MSESLNSIEKDTFYDDVVSLYEMDIPVEEKYEYLSKLYNFKFLYMFLRLFLITIDKGKSEESLVALDYIKKSGDNYYKYMDSLFRAKKAAISIIYFINFMMLGIIIILNSLGVGFVYFMYDNYVMMIMYFSFLIGIVSFVSVKYKNNKLIYKEGRYI